MAVCLVFLLSSLGLAITAQAQDCPKPVPGPNMNLKGNDIVLQEFPDGTKVTFTCEVGYQSAGGSGVSTCSAGNWSPVRLQCERKNCGALEAVINGDITYPTSTLFGDTAVVTCNAGYRRVGRETIRCGDAGWLDRLPVCEVSKCGPPPAIADGTFYPEKEEYEYREVVRYTCQKDLTLNGSKSVSCSEDGTFTPAAPTCINVQCEAPNIDNAEYIAGSLNSYKYKATVTHQCRTGYMMIGQSTSVCEIDGEWSPKLLECQRKNCGALEAVINGTITYPTSTLFGDTAVVTCNTGYKLVGRDTIRCGDAGWLDRLPVCEEVQCKAPNIDNADFTSGSRYPYKYKATVTHQCRTGYMMIGQSTSVCGIDGQWSPKLLECKQLPTPTTTDKPGGKEGDGDGGTDNGGSSTGTTVGIIIGCVAGLFLVVLAIYYFKKKKKAGFQKGTAENETTGDGNSVELQSGKHSAAVGTTLLNEKTSD
ncbi:complement component receptor 1-like protein isoform X11 [Labrus bergylta]|uniref:complement component receptor 1-like protein isoform X11 n=1 Tax=Labrus bergylta TaxID=56723 RepID=UPI0009B449A9|nr:membrane cofactor protein-like isoform X15 [Labrus bergylta]